MVFEARSAMPSQSSIDKPCAAPRAYNSPVRAAAAAQTRERLVAAAFELLALPEGLRGFSLEAVARRAGVQRLTVYNQFGSRRALLEAVFDDIAVRGGLQRLEEVMAEPDPHVGLALLVPVFCEFYAGGQPVMAQLYGAGASDPELKQSLRERNERRRYLLGVLVGRMVAQGDLAADSALDLVDVLWALTGAPFLMELTANGRSPQDACALIHAAVTDAVLRATGRQTTSE
jgi:AcrR family transcriptional regulator